jgi:2-polyprenyl-3-methyl-5-hydroxy-6-metoxy-1,4-benzoquinol methylase
MKGTTLSAPLISEEYRRLNTALHTSPDFGANAKMADKQGRVLSTAISKLKIKSVLDYGCGKGTVLNKLIELHPKVRFFGYDPAIEERSPDPPPCEFVYCHDVLEHVEPEFLTSVLVHLNSKILKLGSLNISTVPAKKTLADGRNAHLIVKKPIWWINKLRKIMNIADTHIVENAVEIALLPNPTRR